MSEENQNKAKSNNPRKVLAQIAAEQTAKKADGPAGVVGVETPEAASVGKPAAAEKPVAAAKPSAEGEPAPAVKAASAAGAASAKETPAAKASEGAASAAMKDSATKAPAVVKASAVEKPTKRAADRQVKPPNDERRKKQLRKHRIAVARNTIIITLLVIVLGSISAFWAFRWGMYDDVADIQGKWQISGTNTTIEISDESFVLTDDISYDYVLNTEDKTLTFKFGALNGSGRYRFSTDRGQLAVQDGEYDWVSTLMADIPWTIDALISSFSGTGPNSPAFDGGLVLERIG